jgi:hypothetical protein
MHIKYDVDYTMNLKQYYVYNPSNKLIIESYLPDSAQSDRLTYKEYYPDGVLKIDAHVATKITPERCCDFIINSIIIGSFNDIIKIKLKFIGPYTSYHNNG